MNNIPIFTIDEHILVDNVNTAFNIKINTSNLQLKKFTTSLRTLMNLTSLKKEVDLYRLLQNQI